MKKIGIIGGIGPAPTLDYYRGIIEGYREEANTEDYPEIIIDSINMTEMLSYVSDKNWEKLAGMLVRSIESLAAAGAVFAAIASNTPHIVFDTVKNLSPLPLISIVDETCKYARANNCRKAVVTGTRFLMSSGLYENELKKYGIEAVVPPEEEQKVIHGIIFPNLENGIVLPEDKLKMLEIINRITLEQRADALILACTELPLMIRENDMDILTLNTTKIHIDAILDYILT